MIIDFIRAFIAIELNDLQIKHAITQYQRELQLSLGPLKLVNPALMHLTLVFLDNIAILTAEKIYTFLEKEINSKFFTPMAEINAELIGVGDFNKRVFFIIIEGQSEFLQKINSKIVQYIREIPEIHLKDEKFHPHLTIARAKEFRPSYGKSHNENTKNPGQIVYKDLKQKYNTYHFGTWKFERVVLKKSVLSPQGPVYTTLTF